MHPPSTAYPLHCLPAGVNQCLKRIQEGLSSRGCGGAQHFPNSLNPGGVARESLTVWREPDKTWKWAFHPLTEHTLADPSHVYWGRGENE